MLKMLQRFIVHFSAWRRRLQCTPKQNNSAYPQYGDYNVRWKKLVASAYDSTKLQKLIYKSTTEADTVLLQYRQSVKKQSK